MFKLMGVYTHKRMKDVAIFIVRRYRLQDGRYKLKIRWMYRNGVDMNLTDYITVVPAELKNWYEMEGT